MATPFSGSVPAAYDRYLGPVLFEPHARDLASRLAGERDVLELAAGTGRLTRQLLARLGDRATVIATDLDDAMLAEARRAIADPRVTWEVADATDLPYPDARFDAVACQFGLMFFPDQARALREARRVLRPRGRLLLTTWNAIVTCAAQHLVHRLALEAYPDDPPRFLEVPFSLCDPAALVALVSGAGFAEVRLSTVAAVAEAPSATELATGLVRGTPLWHQLVARGVDAASFEARVRAELIARFGDAPCRSPLSAHAIEATR